MLLHHADDLVEVMSLLERRLEKPVGRNVAAGHPERTDRSRARGVTVDRDRRTFLPTLWS